MTKDEYSTTVAHLVMERQSVSEEKKAQADMYNEQIKSINDRIYDLSEQFLTGQKDLFDKAEHKGA